MKRFYSIILALCVYICTFAQSQIIRNGDYDHDGQITIADVAKHIDTYIVGFSDSLALKLIWVHDTLYIEKEVLKLDTIYQKETITQHDTIYLYNTEFVHDTLYQDHDIYIHDTTYIDKYNTIYDTVYVDNYITVHDTVYVNNGLSNTYTYKGVTHTIPNAVDVGLKSGTLWSKTSEEYLIESSEDVKELVKSLENTFFRLPTPDECYEMLSLFVDYNKGKSYYEAPFDDNIIDIKITINYNIVDIDMGYLYFYCISESNLCYYYYDAYVWARNINQHMDDDYRLRNRIDPKLYTFDKYPQRIKIPLVKKR